MSNTRGRLAGLTEEEINNLMAKLHTLLPDFSSRDSTRNPASKIVKDVCEYIKMLQQTVDNISETLSQQLAARGIHDFDPDALIRLLQQ